MMKINNIIKGIAFFPPFKGGLGWVFLLLLTLTSCQKDEEESGPLPVITWAMSSGRFRITEGETIMLVPDVENTDETTTYLWTLEGRVVGREDHYTFLGSRQGEYYVKLVVTNRFGQTEDEVKVTVLESENAELPDIPQLSHWRFPWTEISIAEGRTLKVKAYTTEAEATYQWTLDGTPVEGLSGEVAYVFTASEQGLHALTLTQTLGEEQAFQDFTIHVCPPAGTYRRPSTGDSRVNRVYEFMPAPGHQVNGYIIVGDRYPAGCTHEQACDSALSFFRTGKSISLGGQGGYVVAGFDHSVPVARASDSTSYDLCIKGNPFSYQSEPGIIWVSQDDNGDGLPNDQWFELAGSEYGTDNETLEYAITYFRPTAEKSAVGWRDCFGQGGYIPYMSYWNPKPYYWMDWMEGSEWTYFGSRLRDRSTYDNGVSDIPPYDWGYVDNLGQDFIKGPAGQMGYYKISNARTWDGRPANLEYIDFVKIQTAQTGATPNLGEISTEVYYIGENRPTPALP